MSHCEENKGAVIPVHLIQETVMPPYNYQKPQNGFGSISSSQFQDLNQDDKKQDTNPDTLRDME